LFYQYSLFGSPFVTAYVFLVDYPQRLAPTAFGYATATFSVATQYLFSPRVGLLSFTPILMFPMVLAIARKISTLQVQPSESSTEENLRQGLLRTLMLIVLLYGLFYTAFAVLHVARDGEAIGNYNIYSARHLLTVVFPLGFILLDAVARLPTLKSRAAFALGAILAALWLFSLVTNITATLIGDWIFGLDQIWDFLHHVFKIGLWPVLGAGRSLVDW
jgi:hypothetical protein